MEYPDQPRNFEKGRFQSSRRDMKGMKSGRRLREGYQWDRRRGWRIGSVVNVMDLDE
ncbi:hypothetical protein NEUTE2DRAFT_145340 [Neurospora tetrasperma FGSC 2509]|nr:hypothetical protein NEUTE2DRAFT_145340 [Neurospora tetrasperma FGSC 2509]